MDQHPDPQPEPQPAEQQGAPEPPSSPPPPPAPAADPSSRAYWRVTGILLSVGLLIAILTGTVFDYVAGAIQVLPFVGLAVLGYAARRQAWAAVLGVVCLAAILSFVGLLTTLSTLMLHAARAGDSGMLMIHRLPSAAWAQTGVVALIGAGGFAAGLLMLLPPVRRAAARVLPLDPHSVVQALALGLVVGITVTALGQLAAMGSQPVLLSLIKADPRFAREIEGSNLKAGMMYGLLWTLAAIFFIVGFPLVRSAKDALVRLGFVKPTRRQVFGALAISVLMVGGSLLLDGAITFVWKAAGWPRTDVAAFEMLLKPLITPLGAVIIGITAGVSEEITDRGVLQPRLGIFVSNLFFTSLHAYQYGWDGLLSVFLIGLVLGLIRRRTNTSTACIVHGTYDFILVMGSALGFQ